jgi:hypothetical protein
MTEAKEEKAPAKKKMVKKPKGLASRLVEVMKEIKSIEKGGHNDFQNYDYVQEADVKREVRTLLAKHGIAFHFAHIDPITVDRIVKELAKTESGSMDIHTAMKLLEFESRIVQGGLGRQKNQLLHEVRFPIVLECSETGEIRLYRAVGHGIDNADKGIFKAITGAMKYWLMNQFLIPTGDDPERDNQMDKEPEGDYNLDTSGDYASEAPSGPPPGAPKKTRKPPITPKKAGPKGAPPGPRKSKPAPEPEEASSEHEMPEGILELASACGLDQEEFDNLLDRIYGTTKIPKPFHDDLTQKLEDVRDENAFLEYDEDGRLLIVYPDD